MYRDVVRISFCQVSQCGCLQCLGDDKLLVFPICCNLLDLTVHCER